MPLGRAEKRSRGIETDKRLYDRLQRLIEAQQDPRLDTNGLPEYSGYAGGYTAWNLDILGNP